MSERRAIGGGDAYGTHRVIEPPGALPQPAWRLDNDFSRLFAGEVLLAVETLNIDAASFTQMEQEGDVVGIVLRTVAERGKQHNPVTGSGGMLLGRVIQVVPASPEPAGHSPGGQTRALREGDRVELYRVLSADPKELRRRRAK